MVLEDVGKALEITAGAECYNNYSKIYYGSNESLKDLFKCFSLEGKDVLTVLSSSDHLFFAYQNGAFNVDAFDINYLTKYYHYLRRWNILYENRFYPSKNIFCNHKYIYKLLDKVKCEENQEEEALLFWEHYLSRVTPSQHKNLYSMEYYDNSIKNLKKLKEELKKRRFTFYNFDLFTSVSCSKKYDVIITSNILEYAWNSLKLENSYYNLKKLLKPGGQIIGSHFVFFPNSENFVREKELYENSFEYHEFSNYYEEGHRSYPLGYSYTKKRC